MAKKKDANLQDYEARVEQLYYEAIDRAVHIGLKVDYDPDKDFHFADYPIASKDADKLFDWLSQGLEETIAVSAAEQWGRANQQNDILAFGAVGDKDALPKSARERYYGRNDAALAAFLGRKKDGLGLSDRVWNYTEQWRDEVELGLELGLRSGRSAAEMSRDLRIYLKHPDKLFRRVLASYDDDGNPIYKLSKRAKAFHPGQGVYRSSYKNALRLAATETNMAYRASDFERWKRFDFVLGVQVLLSNRHPADDICNALSGKAMGDEKGRYPKEFKFTGWHPFCRCYAVPLLASEDEMQRHKEAVLKGEQYTLRGERVSKPNAYFDKWVQENEERIDRAKSMPYFLRDNKAWMDRALGRGVKTPLDIAAERHAARTEAEKADILARWEERNKKIAAIKNAEHDKQATIKYGNGIASVMDSVSVDTSALKSAIASGDEALIMSEAVKLKTLGKQLNGLQYVQNGWSVAKQYSLNEVLAVEKGIISRLSRETFKTFDDEIKFLKSEITWVENKKKYKTWEVAKRAYEERLNLVAHLKRVAEAKDEIKDAIAYAKTSTSKELKALVKTVSDLLATEYKETSLGFWERYQTAYSALKAKYDKLKAAKLARNKTRIASSTTAQNISTPKTLEHLSEAIVEYEKTENYGDVAKKNKSTIEAIMADVFSKHDLGMNISESSLKKVLDSYFKNTFEVGKSGGYVGSLKTSGKIELEHGRLKAAHKLFGLSKDLDKGQLTRKEYEKYGNVLDHDIERSLTTYNPATQYGEVEVRFKKDKVVATWTAGDSLGLKWQPSLTTAPKSCSFDNFYRTPIDANINTDNFVTFRKNHIASYLELQYHGDLTLDCVESIAFPYDVLTDSHFALVEKCKNKGIKVLHLKDSQLKEITEDDIKKYKRSYD